MRIEDANQIAGERLVAAAQLAREQAEQMQSGFAVEGVRNAWAGTLIEAAEVEGYVDRITTYTLRKAGIAFVREDHLWRTLAGAIYRALLVGAIAGTES